MCVIAAGSEKCGNCTPGFFDYKGPFDIDTGCRSILDMPWEAFYEIVKPLYANENATLMAARCEKLYSNLHLVSEWMVLIPPPVYAVGMNKYSADLPKDRAHLAGQRSLLDGSSAFLRF
jgi:hypothetical protein